MLTAARFRIRLALQGLRAFVLVICALGLGVLGYHHFGGLAWIDALVNAAMILGGMGPVNELHANGGKIFAACYALFSGLAFIVIMGVLFAPVIHRSLHHFHLELDDAAPPADTPQ